MLSGYAKAITTAIGAGLTAALSYYPHAGWIPIAAAMCTMLATYAIPNTPKPPPAISPAESPATVAKSSVEQSQPTFQERMNVT